MSKKFEKSIVFNSDPDRVLEMFRSPDFLGLLASEAVSHSQDIKLHGDRVSIRFEIETDQIPSIVKKFVGKTLKIYDNQELPVTFSADSEAKGSRTIRTSIKQATAQASITFRPKMDRTEVLYEGSVKFDIPIASGKFEKELLELVLSGLDELEAIGNDYLSKSH